MDTDMMIMMVEGACPYAQRSHLRVTRSGGDAVRMIMEDDRSNYNAFGLVHAGAMSGLVETAGGMAVFNHLDPFEHVALNTGLDIRFVRMPRGELYCDAAVTKEQADEAVRRHREGEKADTALELEVRDGEDKVVAKARATFRLISTPEEFKAHFTRMRDLVNRSLRYPPSED